MIKNLRNHYTLFNKKTDKEKQQSKRKKAACCISRFFPKTFLLYDPAPSGNHPYHTLDIFSHGK
jgi:hypothetical protein